MDSKHVLFRRKHGFLLWELWSTLFKVSSWIGSGTKYDASKYEHTRLVRDNGGKRKIVIDGAVMMESITRTLPPGTLYR